MTDAVVADLLGSRPVARRRVKGGYTPAERWVLELDDGRSVFVKVAVNDLTAGWLRDEWRMYAELETPFMAALLAWADGDRPILILEDLSAATWPPPWTDERVAAVLRTLREVAATPPPSWLPDARSSGFLERGWREVQAIPRRSCQPESCHRPGSMLPCPRFCGGRCLPARWRPTAAP